MIRAAFLLLATLLLMAVPAWAGGQAFVALSVTGDGDLARAVAVQEALTKRHGFDAVTMVTDATPREIFPRMKAFLERPGAPGDRRLVWVSGLAAGRNVDFCPPPGAEVTAAAPAIVLAPACLTAALRLPANALHIRQSTPAPERVARYFMGQPSDLPPVAVLALPGHSLEAVARGDRAVLDALNGAAGVGLRPLGLLEVLRRRFPPASGPYVPELDMAGWRSPFLAALNAPPGRG